MVEPILYRMIARVRRHLVAISACNMQANTQFASLHADTEVRSLVGGEDNNAQCEAKVRRFAKR